MVQYDPLQFLPTEEDLPDSDGKPVDNELHILIPALLRAILSLNWGDRTDWFLGLNMGLYFDPKLPAIVPDGFLSLGVPRYKSERGRLSYLIWQENGIAPIWVLEVVSQTPGNEYRNKMTRYAELSILYYTIYNPNHWRRDKHEPFEVYKLIDGQYVRQSGEPFWMPEVGLGIGRGRGQQDGWNREWLYWYNAQGDRLLSPENVIQQERRRAEQERRRAEQEAQRAEQERCRAEQAEQALEQERLQRQALLDMLRDRGIDLENLGLENLGLDNLD
jgi:Uma2 family endonuclease